MSEDMPEDMPDHMPEDMPDRMPNTMSEDMSDRTPEDLPVRKFINVMVGITRSKVFFFLYHEISLFPWVVSLVIYPYRCKRMVTFIVSLTCSPSSGKPSVNPETLFRHWN